MNRLRNFLILMRARLWLVPGGMSFAGLALGYFMLTTGMTWTPSQGAFWIYGGDAESARNLLSALLSGIISMTSLVISLTFVSLTLAANQLGPRLIVSFIADRQIQAVLGLFLATVLYMIFVMRTLGDELGSGGVPHLAITVASALAMACMFALLFYVHKVSRAIIADTVIERVGEELQDAIEETLPGAGEPPPQLPAERLLPAVRRSVSLDASGYVQTIDYAAARRWACANDLLVQFHVQPGEYVLRRGAHLSLRSDREPPVDLPLQALRDTIVLGTERSPAQDLGYFIRQIVEVAVRALSPGVNDPFTAYAAINQLASAVESILERPDRPRSARDEDGALRLVMAPHRAEDYVAMCFDEIRRSAADNVSVLAYLADTFVKLAGDGSRPHACRIAATQLGQIAELARSAGASESDREALRARVRRGLDACRIGPDDADPA